jgi:hypothetical protein
MASAAVVPGLSGGQDSIQVEMGIDKGRDYQIAACIDLFDPGFSSLRFRILPGR